MTADTQSEARKEVRQSVSAAAVPTLLGVMFINMLGFGIVVPLLPFFGKSFDAPAWQVALIFSAYSMGAFFGEPFWGRLSDRIGRKPILISTVAGNCLCYLALAFAPTAAVAFFIRFLGGMASGNGSVIQGYIADVTDEDNLTHRMSHLSAAYNVGFIVGPAVGGLLAHPGAGHAGFRIPLLAASTLSMLCAIALSIFLKESRHRSARFIVQPSRYAVLGQALTSPVIVRLMLVTLLAGCAFNGIESVFALWAQARFQWTPFDVGLAFAVTGIVAAVCQIFITGPLSNRFGESQMLAVGMAITTVCTALQPFSSGIGIVVLLAISAMGQSVAWPNVSAILSRNVDWEHKGQYLGLNNSTGALARLLGPLGASLAFANIGVDWPFFLAGLSVLPAIFLALSTRARSD
jgi:MFS family permease